MIGGNSVLAVIAARGGSKGVPGKNIRPAGGRPLIEWTIDAARASRYIDRVILSSDDPSIIGVAERAGCEAPFRRDAALATDEATSVDVLVDALHRVTGYEIAVLLQPTSPLRRAEDIDRALEQMRSHRASSCVTVGPASAHPYWTFHVDAQGHLDPYCTPPAGEPGPSRRQDLPAAWCLNGAVYAVRVSEFLQSRRLTGPDTVASCMPAERCIDIDTLEDFQRLDAALRVAGALDANESPAR